MKHILVLLLATFALSPLCTAQVPQIINYQGRIAVGGKSFNGVGQFNFSFINADGSQTYWASNDVEINVAAGLFTVRLGDTSLGHMTALTSDIFTDPAHGDVRLRVAFNDGTHGFQIVSPDTRMLAVPYAVAAKTAVTAKTADFAFPASVQEFKLPGTFTFMVPDGVTKILTEVWGAGAGACDSYISELYNSTSGAYSRKVIEVIPGETLNIIIGNGGVGATKSSNLDLLTPAQNGGASQIVRPAGNSDQTPVILCISGGGVAGDTTQVTPTPLPEPDPAAAFGSKGHAFTPYNSPGNPYITGTVEPPFDDVLNAATKNSGFQFYTHLSSPGLWDYYDNNTKVVNYSKGGAGYVLLQW